MKDKIKELLKEYGQRIHDVEADRWVASNEYMEGVFQGEIDSFKEVYQDLLDLLI